MADRHRKLVNKEAGLRGKTEVMLPSGKRLDVKKGGTGIEIERSGSPRKISEAAARLKEAKKTGLVEKVKLKVPHKDLPEAAKAMKRRGLGGTVSNLGGTTKTRV